MIQLSKNQTTNTVAVLPDTEITGAIVGLRFSGSQDYNRNSTYFDGDLISNFDNTDWAIAQISGSTLPSASGLYTFDVIRIIASGPAPTLLKPITDNADINVGVAYQINEYDLGGRSEFEDFLKSRTTALKIVSLN